MQLIHSGMTTQQRSDLLSALVTLEGEDTPTTPAATSSCGGLTTSGLGGDSVDGSAPVGQGENASAPAEQSTAPQVDQASNEPNETS